MLALAETRHFPQTLWVFFRNSSRTMVFPYTNRHTMEMACRLAMCITVFFDIHAYRHFSLQFATSSPGCVEQYEVDRSLTLVLDHLHIQKFWIRMQIRTVWLLFEIHVFVMVSWSGTRFNSLFVHWLPAGCFDKG